MSELVTQSSAIPSGVLLLSGATGAGKTSLCATAAEWVFDKFGMVTRYVLIDGGGFGDKMENLIRLGIVELFRARTRAVGYESDDDIIIETMSLASKGYWPARIDVSSGEVMPGVKMLSPIETEYRMSCPKGHLVKTATSRSALTVVLCSQCKPAMSVTMQNAQIEKSTKIAAHHLNVGLFMFEGLTSGGDWTLDALSGLRARNKLHGEKSNIGAFTSGDMKLDGNNRADVYFAQGEVQKWLLNSTAIPQLKQRPIWTGLEASGIEYGEGFWGPQVPGRAALGKVPQWVGDWLGAQRVVVAEGKPEWRLYLSEFRGEDKLPHRYKVRAVPGTMPAFLADAPSAEPFSGFSLGAYFDLVDKARDIGYEKARAKFPNAPGLRAATTSTRTILAATSAGATASTSPTKREEVSSTQITQPITENATERNTQPTVGGVVAATPAPPTSVKPPMRAGGPPPPIPPPRTSLPPPRPPTLMKKQ